MRHFRRLLLVHVCFCLLLSAVSYAQANDLIIDYVSKSYTYDEYKEFLKSADLPDDFVSYSDLSHFGELDWFSYVPYFHFDAYHYHIIDKQGYEFFINVERKYETPEYIDKYPLLDASQINPSDMRSLPSGEKGRYIIGNMTYWYLSGKLNAIRWHQDGMYFELSVCDPGFAEYPLDANTTIAKLLRIQNKSADELTAILQGNQISPWIYVTAAAVVLIAVSITIFLLKRRKENAKDTST